MIRRVKPRAETGRCVCVNTSLRDFPQPLRYARTQGQGMTEISAQEQQGRNSTLRTITFVLAIWNMAWWLMLATSRWDNEGQEITFFMASQFMMMVVIPPLVSLPALYLAWKNIRLKLAAFLAAIPWMFSILNALIFAVAVAIHGF